MSFYLQCDTYEDNPSAVNGATWESIDHWPGMMIAQSFDLVLEDSCALYSLREIPIPRPSPLYFAFPLVLAWKKSIT